MNNIQKVPKALVKKYTKAQVNAIYAALNFQINEYEPIRTYGRIRYNSTDPRGSRIDPRAFDKVRHLLKKVFHSELIKTYELDETVQEWVDALEADNVSDN